MKILVDDFYCYFDILLHPAKHHRAWRRNRLIQKLDTRQLNLLPLSPSPTPSLRSDNLGLIDYICLSWPFRLIEAFYEIFSLLYAGTLWQPSFPVLQGVDKQSFLFKILLGATLFPLGAYIYTRFWRFIILSGLKLFSEDAILGDKKGLEESVEKVVDSSLVSHAWLILPFFGDLLRGISSFVYLYWGLRENLLLDNKKTFFLLFCPFLLAGLVFLLFGLYLLLILFQFQIFLASF